MREILDLINKEKHQFMVFLCLSLSVTLFTGMISSISAFQKYYGKTNPILVTVFISILGMILLSYLLKKGHFIIYKKDNTKGLLVSALLAVPFAIAIILVDLIVKFPEELNGECKINGVNLPR